MSVFPTSDVKVIAYSLSVAKLILKIRVSLSLKECVLMFPTYNEMIADKRDGDTDHPSKKKCNQPFNKKQKQK